MILFHLFISFFQIGLFSFGGGLATLPFITNLAYSTTWFTDADIANMVAISESTPGPLGINMASYVGYLTDGVIGSLIATLSIVIPSFLVIVLAYKVLNKFSNSKLVKQIFYGLRPASLALITLSFIGVAKLSLVNVSNSILNIINYKALFLFCILYVLIYKFHKHPILYILIAAITGIIFKF